MIDPNASAFPEVYTDWDKDSGRHDTYSSGGLTKRELFAAMFEAAMLSNSGGELNKAAGEYCAEHGLTAGVGMARKSIELANDLIAELNKDAS